MVEVALLLILFQVYLYHGILSLTVQPLLLEISVLMERIPILPSYFGT